MKGLRLKEEIQNSPNLIKYVEEYTQSLIDGETPEGILCSLFDQNLQSIENRNMQKMPARIPLEGCCYPGSKKLYVNVRGNLHICEKFGNRIPIGNVDEGIDFEKVNEAIEEFRSIRESICKEGCWAQRLCTPCIQTAKDPLGGISEQGLLNHCDSSKRQLIDTIIMYARLCEGNPERLKEHIEQFKYA